MIIIIGSFCTNFQKHVFVCLSAVRIIKLGLIHPLFIVWHNEGYWLTGFNKTMIDAKTLDDLVRKLTAAIPPGLKEFEAEARKQFRAILEAGLTKMDLVSREEFDIQVKVLAKTREKIDLLEQQLADLEKRDS